MPRRHKKRESLAGDSLTFSTSSSHTFDYHPVLVIAVIVELSVGTRKDSRER